MELRIWSDLHLEFSAMDVTNDPPVPVLVLSGDIMLAQLLHDYPYNYGETFSEPPIVQGRYQKALEFRKFLLDCSNQYDHVVYVAGNHEFYNSKWHAALDYLREECANYPNVHFLEQDLVKIDDVFFIGGTLWTDCNKRDDLTLYHLKQMMNDFRIIREEKQNFRPISPLDTVIRHERTLGYFKQVILNLRNQHTDPKIVIVGHHAPSNLSIHPRYHNDQVMNGGYYSDLSEFMLDNPEVKLWCHGHTHTTFDYTIGECRVVCNPRGYQSDKYSEYTDWNQNLIIEI
jgi:predicted phosphodiesterase